MTRLFSRLRWACITLACLTIPAIAVAQTPAQPQDPPPTPTQPSANPTDPPAVSTPAQPTTPATPPDASEVRRRLDEALAPQAGGLRAADVARRAEMSSPEVRAKQEAVAAAAAKVDQAAIRFIPQVQLMARYVRLSDLGKASLGSGSLLGTAEPPGQPIPVVCPGGPASTPDQCIIPAAGVELSFPVLLNMWTLQGSIAVPLSDYLLRIPQNQASASKSKQAAETQEKAARIKARLDAKIAFFNWIRAQGGVLVSEQGLANANAHLKDVAVAVQVGSASRADLLAVEGQVASTELLVENARSMTDLVEEQLRVMMHDPETTRYKIGEDINAPVAGEPATTTLRTLFAEALGNRLERRSIEESLASLRDTRRVISAGNYPRLDAFGNLYYSNPNSRKFPQEEKWTASWDVGIQLSWTINDTLSTGHQLSELDAKILEIESQRAQLDDGIRLQVTNAYTSLRRAKVSKETTERQLQSAEESYRVRRELFRAGRATSSELTDAETALLKAGFDALNARIDLRVARENLNYALGRDAVRPR